MDMTDDDGGTAMALALKMAMACAHDDNTCAAASYIALPPITLQPLQPCDAKMAQSKGYFDCPASGLRAHIHELSLLRSRAAAGESLARRGERGRGGSSHGEGPAPGSGQSGSSTRNGAPLFRPLLCIPPRSAYHFDQDSCRITYATGSFWMVP